jgi:methylated-DNA-[protein]-cysteine S-methyltransferase
MTTTLVSIQQACTASCVFDSPLGRMLLARTAAGLAGVWFDAQQHHPMAWRVPGACAGAPGNAPTDATPNAPGAPPDALLSGTRQLLMRYFNGEPVHFDLPLDLHGTPFQRAVWQALRSIPRGQTRCYGDIAAQLGAPKASRAVGAAVGRNPLSIVVPCHRVLGAAGALTGYAGGLERKMALLELERGGVAERAHRAGASARAAA